MKAVPVGRKSKTAVAPPPTHVEISSGGHQVIVQAIGPLDDVSAKAVQIWRDIRETAGPAAAEESISVGFALVSDPVTSPLMTPEAELPYRLLPDVDVEAPE